MKTTSASRFSSSSKGFSLVEILVTISIVVVLMGLTFGVGRMALMNANASKARTQVGLFESNIQKYEADNGEFPPGDGSSTSTRELSRFLYEIGIEQGGKVYMPELDPDQSAQFKKIRNGVVYDPFKKKPYFYLRGVDENGQAVDSAYNPDFDLWSLGPNMIGRGDGGTTEEATEDDIGNW